VCVHGAMHIGQGCACTPRLGSGLRAGSCELSLAVLAVLAAAPLAAVGADGKEHVRFASTARRVVAATDAT